jgi:uncharacterized caspase-like protein
LFSLVASLPCAAAGTRVALIIGNSDYANANLKLPNPVNDATAMQRALKAAGFETIVRLNAKRLDFYRAVDEFGTRIGRDPHAVGLFYYAGHGVQAEGVNYLIPVDADIQSEADLDANAFDAGRVLRAMKTAQNEMNIVILDACRDNPLPKTRGIERGLARMDAPSGTFIAYAAAPGQSAQDGADGTNGVFTGELVKAMAETGVPLEEMFKKVIAGVKADTHGSQQPWSEASIQGDFYFHAAGQPPASAPQLPPGAPATASRTPAADEMAAYKAAEASNTLAGWQIFKRNYPNSAYAAAADIRIASLTPSRAAASAPREAQVQPQSQPQAQPQAQPAWSPVDPGMVGTYEYDNVYNFYDQRFIATVAADGRCHLTITQEESGTWQQAFGIWHTTGAKTHHSRSGTYRVVGGNAIALTGEGGTAVYRPMQSGITVDPRNPVMLGPWHASVVSGGATWEVIIQNNANGTYEIRARFEDSASCGYSNNQWHFNSTISGHSDGGTYRIIDARQVEFTGSQGTSIWRRR